MKQAVKYAAEEEVRSKNLVFFGTEDAEDDEEDFEVDPNGAVEALGIEPMFESAKKLGLWKPGHKRPVLVTLRNAASAVEILRKSHLLRQIEEFKTVYISPDRSLEQRKQHRELVGELTQRREEKRPGDENVRFVIRDGEIVTLPRSLD